MVAGDSPEQPGGLLTGLVPGSRVAGYLLERLVGVGGAAAVYRARDERLGRVVALKLLAGDESVRQRFAREARAVAAVDHPHIIPVYEAGEAGGVLFIAMRFVAGDDLRVILEREGGLGPRRAAAFISPVASALDAAHDAGLVHRDVKPANMLVDVGPGRPEHVYLSDFGVVKGMLSSRRADPGRAVRRHPRVLGARADKRPRRGRPRGSVRAGVRGVPAADRLAAVRARSADGDALRPSVRAAAAGDLGAAGPARCRGPGAGPGTGEGAGRPVRQLRRLRRRAAGGARRGALRFLRPPGGQRTATVLLAGAAAGARGRP